MATQPGNFLEQLRATFAVEAREHLQAMGSGLLAIEKAERDGQAPLVESVFRAAHSLKGAARAVDHADIELLCESLEDVFAAWKRGESSPSAALIDAAHRTLDAIGALLDAPPDQPPNDGPLQRTAPRMPPVDASRAEVASPPAAVAEPVRRQASTSHRERALAPPANTGAYAQSAADAMRSDQTVRIAVSKLQARLFEAEEMLGVKLSAAQQAADLRQLRERAGSWRKAWTPVEGAARELRRRRSAAAHVPAAAELDSVVDFLDWTVDHLASIETEAERLVAAAARQHRIVGKQVDELLDDTKRLLLLPFGTICGSFAKLVRDLCREQRKEADLVIRGEHVEIDKRVLEQIKDPLVHLLRNSVDHGLETPAERIRQGKPQRGTITLEVSQVADKARIVLEDDGAGIDLASVKASAVKRGLISADQARQLDEAQAQALVFESDVSTSPILTRVSGRGLGLAIVREHARRLGGDVALESRAGRGTRIVIEVPLLQATFRGILVEVEDRVFVLPTLEVERVTRIRHDDVRTVKGRETVAIAGRAIALVRLAQVLELPAAGRRAVPALVPVIVMGQGDQRVAFIVDSVLNEQELLVRPLRKPLLRVRNVAAATVLGSGEVVPVLNVADLLVSARKAGQRAALPGAADIQAPAQSILVAEDSITSRMLMKSILEASGYAVRTAVDGVDALAMLRADRYDLVVSDVEMPRLNGFDLATRIRADRRLAELPVILVTALESAEDRARGVDVGANAYLVKSSFDQSDLIDAVRRLV